MTNVIIFDIVQKNEYQLQRLVDTFENYRHDTAQGVIINEYNESFLKATYWHKKLQKRYRFNIEKKDFDVVDEEVVTVADFEIQIEDKKLLILGNKQIAQRIITMISIVSGNAYSITEFIINIERLVQKICKEPNIILAKMRLTDITIEKGLLVNCSVNLLEQDDPKELALKYINNIVSIAFKLERAEANIIIYKSGKFSISKVTDDETDELIDSIVRIVR